MNRQLFVFVIFFLLVFGLYPPTQSKAETFRLGIVDQFYFTKEHPVAQSLAKKGLIIGKNLVLVPISIKGFQTEHGRQRIKKEIEEKCDLFFVNGQFLRAVYQLQLKSPLVFVGTSCTESTLPTTMQQNATGIYWGSTDDTFRKTLNMLPTVQKKKLGLLYLKDSTLKSRKKYYEKICKRYGAELIIKEFSDRKEIEQVFRAFKEEKVDAVMLFPMTARNEDLDEVIKWQNQLKLPVIGQMEDQVRQGLLGGPVIDLKTYPQQLADYIMKIFNGRSPGQLPVKHMSRKYMVNLGTVRDLGVLIPHEIIDQAEIVGIASDNNPKAEDDMPLVPGSFTIGVSENIAANPLAMITEALAARGYVEGQNLTFKRIDFRDITGQKNQTAAVELLQAETDILFFTGSTLPSIFKLKKSQTPICFVSTGELLEMIPEGLKSNVTGVVRASLGSIFEKSQKLVPGAKRMGLLAQTNSNSNHNIESKRQEAQKYGLSIEFRNFSSPAEIGPIMQEMQKTNDFLLLFPSSVTDRDLAEIVLWQNRLNFPVLGQLKSFVEKGLLGGAVVDVEKVIPKVAEFIDKILKGRNPSSLPIYYYPEKYVINLRTASLLKRDIPAEITAQAEIIH